MRAVQLQLREAEERTCLAEERARASEAAMRQAEQATRRAEGALEDAMECRICFAVFDSAAHAQVALLPCGHVMCMVCAVQVQDSPGRHCHVCSVATKVAPVRLYTGSNN